MARNADGRTAGGHARFPLTHSPSWPQAKRARCLISLMLVGCTWSKEFAPPRGQNLINSAKKINKPLDLLLAQWVDADAIRITN